MDFKKRIQTPDKRQVFTEDGYFIWGASVVKNEKGKYHMFASRWKKEKTFKSWVTHSEIVRAVSDKPEGPFKTIEVLQVLKEQNWSEKMVHNPTIKKIKGKYYLFYLGSTYIDEVPDIPDEVNTHPARFNQRIGVAVSESPEGPWIPSHHNPILKPRQGEWDSTFVTNPAIFVEDDEIRIIYKSKWAFQQEGENRLALGLAVANHPEGPYERKGPSPLLSYDVEDPFVWKENNKYWMCVKDMTGAIAGKYNGVLLESEDFLNWRLNEYSKAWDHQLVWSDGQAETPYFIERPQLLIEDGKPVCLYMAVGDGKTYSYNLARRVI